jgi:P-type Cu2+ transporter
MEQAVKHMESGHLVKDSFKVSGMTCASCAISLESYLGPLEGVSSVSVNYPNQSVAIEFDDAIITTETLGLKAKEIGYEIFTKAAGEEGETFEESEDKRLSVLRSKLIFSAVFSIPVFVIAMFFMGEIPYQNWIMFALATPVMLWSGSEFFVIAWRKIQHLSSNMDTLVALSTGVAYIFSVVNTVYPQYFLSRGVEPHVYYESAVIIITLILLGRYLEERAKRKTSSAIKKLMGLKPKEVTVIRNGAEVIIPYEEIARAELIVLKPGDRVPVDGKVKKGDSFVDESMITGEPIPVRKIKGEKVFAGTINQKGVLRILASKVGSETLLAQIIMLVEQAQASKPAIQKLADKVAGIFVPVVVVLATITFIAWYLVGPEPSFTYALAALITVLIIACPCALGLATPTALMVGIGKGAEQGILIKDAQVLETAFKIDTLILDKTGTITEGKPRVTDMVWDGGNTDAKYQQALLAIESSSEHPLAEAIVNHLRDLNTASVEVDSFESITGMGVTAKIAGETYRVGNDRFMQNSRVNIDENLSRCADKLKSEAKTVVYFSYRATVVGIIGIADQVKENAAAAVKDIHHMGIDIYMLTGDNEQTAAVIAEQVGIKHFIANVMPADKGNFVKEMQEQNKVVAMVGDGINDSHALAQADVGIAMGSGTDIAMESAGITLMHSDLKQIAKAIGLSKATMRTIRQNLFWAFVYNLVAIPVAAGVLYPAFGFLLNPMIAGAAMSMSSISVLLNSLRLKKRRF